MIGAEEAKELILQKHHDLVTDQLQKYVDLEKRNLLQIFENLIVKYFNALSEIVNQQNKTSGLMGESLEKFIENNEDRSKPLFELCTKFKSGGTPRSDNSAFYGGNIPFVTIDDMTSRPSILIRRQKKLQTLFGWFQLLEGSC